MLVGPSMRDYLAINRATFDSLADEYDSRWKRYLDHQEAVIRPFADSLKARFKGPIHILDVGCGVGLDSHILSSQGFRVDGLDFSANMTAKARINAPHATFITDDFLSFRNERRYQGVVMDAFIHLFPESEVTNVLRRLRTVMIPTGLAFVSTTASESSSEGFIGKKDYPGRAVRFRRFWTESGLRRTFGDSGFRVTDFYSDQEPTTGKIWMNMVVE